MDPIKTQKFQAMKKHRRNQFLYYNYLSTLPTAVLAFALVFNHIYSFWYSPYRLCSSMKRFLLTSLPFFWSSFFDPKCLFIVVNVIILFLIGESRCVHATSNSPARDIYSEYIERTRTQTRTRSLEERQEEVKESEVMKLAEKIEVEWKGVVTAEDNEIEVKQVEDRAVEEISENIEEIKEKRDVREESGLLETEELNKRVEELIARVNKQWRLEAQSLVCCQA